MKISIDENLRGKELFDFLIQNKNELIAQKKSLIKHTEAVFCKSKPLAAATKSDTALKAINGDIPPDATTLQVKVVANTAFYCDSAMDVLIRDNAKKSIKERKGLIPHLHDHVHELTAEVGEVKDIYYEDISLRELGWDAPGTAQALIFETEIKKSYNEQIFEKYKSGRVKFHSIGLQYIKLELAVNDEENEKEFDFWNKYYPNIINKDVVDQRGYFWVVSQIKLLENSAVLLAANDLTPVLETTKNTETQPLHSTENQPFDLDHAIKTIKFFN